MAEEAAQPDTLSGDMAAMESYWTLVAAILDGADAIHAGGEDYLPKFANETVPDYKDRLDGGKFSNIFRDIVESLASKPFAKQVDFAKPTDVSTDLKGLAEDIDGQGNHLHVFASSVFFNGIANGIDWILVDKAPVATDSPRQLTVSDEKVAGATPYWVHIPAGQMVAAYSTMIDGKEEFIHVRFLEPEVKREGYAEIELHRVRVLNREPIELDGKTTYAPATWQLLEERPDPQNTDKTIWVQVGAGPIAIGIIPLVAFLTGRRKGSSWQVLPPMKDAAHLQIKHYQAETNLEYAKNLTAAPMLSNDLTPVLETLEYQDEHGVTRRQEMPPTVPVGPKRVLWGGTWNYVEISATGLTFLANEVKRTEDQLREIGRQPVLAQVGVTVISAANASQKASSVLQAWVFGLKDVLELLMIYTGKWMGRDEAPEIFVHDDFALDMESDKAPDFLLALRKNNDISRKALIVEAKRRNFLSPEYDEEADLTDILAEVPGDDADDDIIAAAPPVDPNNPPPPEV